MEWSRVWRMVVSDTGELEREAEMRRGWKRIGTG